MADTVRKKRLFLGYYSGNKINPDTEISDIELIKRDLLNHFHTSKGERVMRPNFGSIIWDLLFEPLDAPTKEAILADVENVIGQEPRVELQDLDIIEFEHGLRIEVGLLYVPFNALATFSVDFDRRNSSQNISNNLLIEDIQR